MEASTEQQERQPLTRVQRTIARRMAESKATVPDFSLRATAAMDDAMALRRRLKAEAGEVPAPSVNDLVIRACALALRANPIANASYRDDGFEHHERVNVGVAVAAGDALLVPTIADADVKSLGEIAAESRRLAERVREGAITAAELSGGTFTVSNLGMYGIDGFTAIVNPPQAAILAVGAVRRAAVAEEDGTLRSGLLMDLTLSCDHRILYGAHAARLLADVRAGLERPASLT